MSHSPSRGRLRFSQVVKLGRIWRSMEWLLAVLLACGNHAPPSSLRTPIPKLACPMTAFVGNEVTFDASASTSSTSSIVSYRFDFGDHTAVNEGSPLVSHIYDRPGVFQVTLYVTDAAGGRNWDSLDITVVEDQPPAATLSVPQSALTDAPVRFDSSGSRDADRIASYTFDFGDGYNLLTQIDPVATYSYRRAGVFRASVTATNNHGQSSTAHAEIVIGLALSAPMNLSNTPYDSVVTGIAVDANDDLDFVWWDSKESLLRAGRIVGQPGGDGRLMPGGVAVSDPTLSWDVSLPGIAIAPTTAHPIHLPWAWDPPP